VPQNSKSQNDLQLLSKRMKFWTTVRLRIVVPTTYHTQETEKLPHKQGTLLGPECKR